MVHRTALLGQRPMLLLPLLKNQSCSSLAEILLAHLPSVRPTLSPCSFFSSSSLCLCCYHPFHLLPLLSILSFNLPFLFIVILILSNSVSPFLSSSFSFSSSSFSLFLSSSSSSSSLSSSPCASYFFSQSISSCSCSSSYSFS